MYTRVACVRMSHGGTRVGMPRIEQPYTYEQVVVLYRYALVCRSGTVVVRIWIGARVDRVWQSGTVWSRQCNAESIVLYYQHCDQ